MRRLPMAVVLLTLATLSACNVARASTDVDEAKLANFGSTGLLRWENIAGPPYWISGTPLTFETAKHVRFARIGPGQNVLVHVPAGSMLRVVSVNAPLQPDDVQMWVSNGSGLYRAALSAIVGSDGSLLLTPAEGEASLVRVSRAPDRAGCVDVAMFFSRRMVPDEAFPYSCQWVGCEPAVTLSRDKSVLGSFQYLPAGQSVQIQVSAPARLRLESHLLYAPLEAESNQTYQLRIHGDNTPPRVQQIHTRFDRRHVHEVDGKVRLLGEQEVDYLDIPAGAEQLVVMSTANTFVRITVAPCRTAYPAGWEASDDASVVGSIWNLNADEVSSQLTAADYPASRRWRIAQRLGRDNRYRDGGIQAWNLLRQLAAENPAHPDLGRWANKAKFTYTTFQPLLPVQASHTVAMADAWFVTRSLISPTATAFSPVVASSMTDDSISTLAGGTFVEVQPAGEIACLLPPGVLDTQVRLAVQRQRRSSPSEIRVQCDASAPVHLSLNSSEALPTALQQPATAEGGLAVLHRQFGPFDAGTLGGPFANRRHAAPLIEAATAELNVAGGTRWIRLINDSEHPLRVCLAYRASRQVALTESEFLSNLTQQGDFGQTFLAVLRGETPAGLSDADAFAELRNHCEPLLRRLHIQYQTFAAGIARPDDELSADARVTSATEKDEEARRRQARQLMEQQQWLATLSLWTSVADRSTGSSRQEAILQRIEALLALGEAFLAETELRGRVLYDPDPALRAAAARRLAEVYQQAGDNESLQRLASAALLTDPSNETIATLATAAASNDDWPTALIAILATPPQQRSAELLLEATYHQRWWQIFHLTLEQLADPPLKSYWGALWSTRQGDFATAARLLAHGGQREEELRSHIVRGHRIAERLRQTSLDDRLQAMREWEAWTSTHPGPHAWRRDESMVSACERVDQVVYEPSDDGYSAYRATVDQPVQLCINGPVELRIEVRPLHRADTQTTLDDWLVVRGSGRQLVWPITRNRRSDNLQLRTDPEHVPGRRVETQLRLGPGQHRLRVSAETSDVLVRVAARRPQHSLGMLPPITPFTVDAITQGHWGGQMLNGIAGQAANDAPICARQTSDGISVTDVVELPLMQPTTTALVSSPPVSPIVTAWQHAALALRDGTLTVDEARRVLSVQSSAPPNANIDEMFELVARADLPPSALPSLHDPQAAIDWQWMSVYHGQLADALRVDPGSDERARHTHVALLLRMAEQQPVERAPCAVRLAELAQRYPADAFTAEQFNRLKEPGEWILFREVDSSAGLYFLPDAGPQPMSQASRVRHALARPVDPPGSLPDYLITGYRQLSLHVVEPQPVVMELALHQPRIGYLPAPPLQIEVKVDDASLPSFVMPSDDEHRVRIPLAAGQHRVNVRITNPFAGHYVFLNVHEIDSTGQRKPWQPTDGESSAERLYHVATPATPVQLRMRGPTWIRVERVVEGQRQIDETTIAQGDREVTLSAPEGIKHALYRIWEYRFGEAPSEPPVFAVPPTPLAPTRRWLDPAVVNATNVTGATGTPGQTTPWDWPAQHALPLPQPELAGLAPADAPASTVDVWDAFPLGGYEDGTWSWGTGVVHRRALEEGRQQTGEDRFVQLALAHEHFQPESKSYAKTMGLFRLRESSGPTFGLTHESWQPLPNLIHPVLPDTIHGRPETAWLNSLNWNNSWTAYLQHPSDAISSYDGQTEVSLGTRSRIYWRHDLAHHGYHIPSLTFFARWLSMDDSLYQPERVDQDVFTPFKNDHRVGFYLTDSWIYEPIEFARVWLRPAVFTNEDLNPFRPDHISLQAGVSSLWQQMDWQLAYRVARFFDDADRSQANTQHLLYVDATIDHWQHAGNRYELAVSVRHELADSETSAFLTLTRFVSRGRGYRDQHPSEIGFRSLRERSAYPTWQFFEPFGL